MERNLKLDVEWTNSLKIAIYNGQKLRQMGHKSVWLPVTLSSRWPPPPRVMSRPKFKYMESLKSLTDFDEIFDKGRNFREQISDLK